MKFIDFRAYLERITDTSSTSMRVCILAELANLSAANEREVCAHLAGSLEAGTDAALEHGDAIARAIRARGDE